MSSRVILSLMAVALVALYRIGSVPTVFAQVPTASPTMSPSGMPTLAPTGDHGASFLPDQCYKHCLFDHNMYLASTQDAKNFLASQIFAGCDDTTVLAQSVELCMDSCSSCSDSAAVNDHYWWAHSSNFTWTTPPLGVLRVNNSIPWHRFTFAGADSFMPKHADDIFFGDIRVGRHIDFAQSMNFSFYLLEHTKVKLFFNSTDMYMNDQNVAEQTNAVYLDTQIVDSFDVNASVVTYFSNSSWGHSFRSTVLRPSNRGLIGGENFQVDINGKRLDYGDYESVVFLDLNIFSHAPVTISGP